MFCGLVCAPTAREARQPSYASVRGIYNALRTYFVHYGHINATVLMCTCVHTCIYARMFACMHAYVGCMFVCAYTCAHMLVCLC